MSMSCTVPFFIKGAYDSFYLASINIYVDDVICQGLYLHQQKHQKIQDSLIIFQGYCI
jgi:hypothetical protein